MASVTSLKREAELLPNMKPLQFDLTQKQRQASRTILRKIRLHTKQVQALELKERLVLLTYLLAQAKIALVTQDEEKLAHVAAKFLQGDVTSLEGLEEDIAKAQTLGKELTVFYRQLTHQRGSLPRTLSEYKKMHERITKEFEEFMTLAENMKNNEEPDRVH
ncbi:hypothetical protein HY639_05115 [Candidatus Woesearchaeota archaeon]|nr:hypothetical protein [Candidatus Woesearchaeota archaeon]